MPVGKPLRKDFYSDSDGGAHDIEMPPINEQPPIVAAAPDPWALAPHSQETSAAAPVPDYIPQETIDEMQESFEPEEQEVEEEVAPAPVKKSNSSTAENMRVLREAREKAERERDELLRYMQMQQMQQTSKPQPEVEEEVDLDIDDDALVEGKEIRKMYKEMNAMKKQLRSYQHQSNESITEAKIKAAYPDFDKVVSQDNIAALRDQYPELANTLHSTTDLYSKAVSAYTLIKQFGIHRDQVIENDKARVARNVSKPRPLASVNPQQGDSPLSKANAFANGEFSQTDAKRLREEMFAAMKNR